MSGRPADSAAASGDEAPGSLIVGTGTLYVACGEGTRMQVEAVQIEGRKRVTAQEFANGARLVPGERFGT